MDPFTARNHVILLVPAEAQTQETGQENCSGRHNVFKLKKTTSACWLGHFIVGEPRVLHCVFVCPDYLSRHCAAGGEAAQQEEEP